ncbi:hypothetical protein H4R35_004972, partial [Dimargaris xerosporica]
MLSNHTPMAVTDADLARAFGTVLDNCPGAIAELKSLCTTLGLQADDLFYKWESYSIQQERTNKANDALQPTMGPVQPQGDHLARFRQYINRDLEKQAHANSIAHTPERKGYGLAVGTPGSQKKAGLLNYGLNRGSKGAMLGSPGFKEPRTYDCSNVDALIQNLASPRTPQKSQRSDHGLGSMASLPPHLRTPTSKTRGASAIFSPQSYVSPSARLDLSIQSTNAPSPLFIGFHDFGCYTLFFMYFLDFFDLIQSPSPQSKRFSERVNRG